MASNEIKAALDLRHNQILFIYMVVYGGLNENRLAFEMSPNFGKSACLGIIGSLMYRKDKERLYIIVEPNHFLAFYHHKLYASEDALLSK